MSATETFYDVIRRQGMTRRSFTKFCSLTAASMGLGATGAATVAQALETKPRVPVIWMHGLECTCCSESFIRSAHPLVKDVVLSMISLDYDDTHHGRRRAIRPRRSSKKPRKNTKASIFWRSKAIRRSMKAACSASTAAGPSSKSSSGWRRTPRPSSPGAPAPPGAACRPPSRTRPRPRRSTRSSPTSRSSRCRAARPSPKS